MDEALRLRRAFVGERPTSPVSAVLLGRGTMAQLPEAGSQYMSPDRLRSGLEECFGPGAISQFARISGISRSQISRYLNASCPIPKHVAWLVDLCVAAKRVDIWLNAITGSAATLAKQIQEARAACCDTMCGENAPHIYEESKSL